MNTPVAIFIFNRPETTKQLMRKVAQVKPQRLFLIGDGPRENYRDDLIKCEAARKEVFDNIGWDCDVHENFSDTNLGLRKRIASGITWVFKNVNEAIFLEDDCIPDLSFFPFCEELLKRYREDSRIMVISGNNFQSGRKRTNYSYYFSRYNHCWGWASWKRAWNYYDDKMVYWPELRDNGWLKDILHERDAVEYWKNIFQRVYDEEINSWAYRWTYSCWLQSGLTILPAKNLVMNIGFGQGATNTKLQGFRQIQKYESIEFPLKHPPYIVRDDQADRYSQLHHFGSSLSKRLKRKIVKTLMSLKLWR